MGKVFGAFTDISWTSDRGWISGNGNTFVFSLRDDFNFAKFKCLNKKDEVHHRADLMIYIGHIASGFYIADDCNINTKSCSNFGYNG